MYNLPVQIVWMIYWVTLKISIMPCMRTIRFFICSFSSLRSCWFHISMFDCYTIDIPDRQRNSKDIIRGVNSIKVRVKRPHVVTLTTLDTRLTSSSFGALVSQTDMATKDNRPLLLSDWVTLCHLVIGICWRQNVTVYEAVLTNILGEGGGA